MTVHEDEAVMLYLHSYYYIIGNRDVCIYQSLYGLVMNVL
jgi:hypothetical protein